MASSVNQQQSFPTIPRPPSAGDYEMRDSHAPHDLSRPTINQTPYLTPYLGLRARLSQIWINKWTVLFLLILVRLIFLTQSTNHGLVSARKEAMSACTQVENIGSSLASMPHFMSQGINEMTATGVEKAVSGLSTMLGYSVNAIEEIVLFVIHMMTSTYLCLITLAVSGSLHAAVEIGQDVASALNNTINAVTGDIANKTESVTNGINDLMSAINKVKGIPGLPDGGLQAPTIDLTDDINKLKALDLPDDLTNGLEKLNSSIPTFEDVQNFTDSIISLPFEEVKKLISNNMGNFTFDRQLLPVPQKDQLTFCSDGNDINNFFDGLDKIVYDARKAAIAVLVVAAIIVAIPMAYTEIRRYRRLRETVMYFEKDYDKMDVGYMVQRPHSSRFGLWLGSKVGEGRRRNAFRWAFAYMTTFPMLALLALGIAGLISALGQYLILKSLVDEVPKLTNEVADFAEKVVGSLNNASMSWSTGVNGAITKLDSDINNDILGWVNTTTTAVNGTLNGFVDKMNDVLNTTFGGTVLYDPIKDVMNCLIGLKIAGVESGLTWVQDNAHVQFPGVPNNTFSLGALAQVSNSSSAADLLANPNGKTEDEVTEAITSVVNWIKSGIKQEAIIAGVLVVLWFLSAVGGCIAACIMAYRSKPTRFIDPYIINPNIHDDGSAPTQVQDHRNTPAPPYQASPHFNQARTFRSYPDDDAESPVEKTGQVGAHAVSDSARPGHLRVSSYGDVTRASPLDEKSNPFNSPFDHPDDRKRSPH